MSILPTLPDSGQISQIENIMKLGGRGQHLQLHPLPQLSRTNDQPWYQIDDVIIEIAILAEVPASDGLEYFIDRHL